MFEKTENKRKRGQGWPIFNKKEYLAIFLVNSYYAQPRGQSFIKACKNALNRAVVLAQLVKRSLPKPESCGSNRVIGKILD